MSEPILIMNSVITQQKLWYRTCLFISLFHLIFIIIGLFTCNLPVCKSQTSNLDESLHKWYSMSWLLNNEQKKMCSIAIKNTNVDHFLPVPWPRCAHVRPWVWTCPAAARSVDWSSPPSTLRSGSASSCGSPHTPATPEQRRYTCRQLVKNILNSYWWTFFMFVLFHLFFFILTKVLKWCFKYYEVNIVGQIFTQIYTIGIGYIIAVIEIELKRYHDLNNEDIMLTFRSQIWGTIEPKTIGFCHMSHTDCQYRQWRFYKNIVKLWM